MDLKLPPLPYLHESVRPGHRVPRLMLGQGFFSMDNDEELKVRWKNIFGENDDDDDDDSDDDDDEEDEEEEGESGEIAGKKKGKKKREGVIEWNWYDEAMKDILVQLYTTSWWLTAEEIEEALDDIEVR